MYFDYDVLIGIALAVFGLIALCRGIIVRKKSITALGTVASIVEENQGYTAIIKYQYLGETFYKRAINSIGKQPNYQIGQSFEICFDPSSTKDEVYIAGNHKDLWIAGACVVGGILFALISYL